MEKDLRTPDEVISEILGRYSVTDLLEQTRADMERADELFYRADAPIEIIAQGETNMVRWWKVLSGSSFYEVRRFQTFVWCSCKSFFFSKKMCKHLAFTSGVYCQLCRQMAAKTGKLCYDCDMTVNHFLKPTPGAKPVFTGATT